MVSPMRLGSDGGGEGVLVGGQEPAHGVDGGALDLRLLVLGAGRRRARRSYG